MLRSLCFIIVLSQAAEAVAEPTVFYLARPRAVGRRVPASLMFDLQGKIKSIISARNRLLVEGEEDASLVSGPDVDRRVLLRRVDEARRFHEELDTEGARRELQAVLGAIGPLPTTPDAREVWQKALVLSVEIAEAEQDLSTRDRVIGELLRVIPDLNPTAAGFAGPLADVVLARKATLPTAVAVRFRLRPADARIFVDGRPFQSGDRLRSGVHRVLVRAAAHRAHTDSFRVDPSTGSPTIKVALKRAQLRTHPQLDSSLATPDGGPQSVRQLGDIVRQSGANIGLLATVGRRSDGRFDLHIAAVGRDGRVVGVGTMVTGGLLAEADLAHIIGAASRKGQGRATAPGDWNATPQLESDTPDPNDFAGLPVETTRATLPSQRKRSLLRSPNFWIFTSFAVLGGGGAYLAYTLQEAPREEVYLLPSMTVEVALP